MGYKQYTIRLSLDTVKQKRACQMLDECGRAKGFLISEALCLYEDIMRRGMESNASSGSHATPYREEPEPIPVRPPVQTSTKEPIETGKSDTVNPVIENKEPVKREENTSFKGSTIDVSVPEQEVDIMPESTDEPGIEDIRVDEGQATKEDPYTDLLKAMTHRQSETAEVDPAKAIVAI